jgi:hypothetical protein
MSASELGYEQGFGLGQCMPFAPKLMTTRLATRTELHFIRIFARDDIRCGRCTEFVRRMGLCLGQD